MNKNKRIIIYSVNTNSYDKYIYSKSMNKVFNRNSFIKYYIFTDKINEFNEQKFIEQVFLKKIKDDIYEFFFKNHSKIIKIPLGISLDRFIKLNPIKVLPDHDISIYHDARITIFPKLISELNKFKDDYDWISVRHRFRKSLNKELLICCAYQKISFGRFSRIKEYIFKKQFQDEEENYSILSENGLIIRKSNNKVRILSRIWTNLTKLTKRDQISLPLSFFELRKMNLKRIFLSDFNNSKLCKLNSRQNQYILIKRLYIKFVITLRFLLASFIAYTMRIKNI